MGYLAYRNYMYVPFFRDPALLWMSDKTSSMARGLRPGKQAFIIFTRQSNPTKSRAVNASVNALCS